MNYIMSSLRPLQKFTFAAALSCAGMLQSSYAQTATNRAVSPSFSKPGQFNRWTSPLSSDSNGLAFSTQAAITKRTARPPDDSGPHHLSWAISGPTQQGSTNKAAGGRVVAMASGMNFWDGTKWAPSEPSFEISETGDAFVANKVYHKTSLSSDLNAAGAVTMTTGGTVLRSSPVAIALFDPISGAFQVIGVVTNSPAVQTDSNRVEYASAFFGDVCADVVFTIEKGTFRQDIVFTGKLDPRAWGFAADTARIQLITEFFDAPEPERLRRPIYVEQNQTIRDRSVSPDLVDDQLRFDELLFITGHARSEAGSASDASAHAVVGKEFRTDASGRKFLVESVPYRSVAELMSALPNCAPRQAGLDRSRSLGSSYASIPSLGGKAIAKGLVAARTKKIAARAPGAPAVAIDSVVTIGPGYGTPTTFSSDTTYFVSGPVFINSCVIEGGAVF
jgi:hypothetical protein